MKQTKKVNPESSVYSDREAHEEVIAAGVEDYFIKPIPQEESSRIWKRG